MNTTQDGSGRLLSRLPIKHHVSYYLANWS